MKTRTRLSAALAAVLFTVTFSACDSQQSSTSPSEQNPGGSAAFAIDSTADTVGKALIGISLVSAVPTDTGVLLKVQLPHPNLAVHLIRISPLRDTVIVNILDSSAGDTGNVTRSFRSSTLPQRLLLVGEETNPGQVDAQVISTVRFNVPWSEISFYAQFIGRNGTVVTVMEPGVGLD
jgi:hypothetical protein